MEYISNSLLNVFGMDMAYFERSVPVTKDIFVILLAVGWALLLGNLVFQAMRGMAAGIGFDGEDPKILFMRTCIFSFLLLVSRQICNIGLGMTGMVINMLQVPSSVQIPMPEETTFSIGASWLLVILIGFIVMWQVVRLFFEVGERYVVTAVLTILSPLAFAMGGSKSTEDIFKGWVRMFCSMCLMMVFNVIFLKMLISVLAVMPSGTEVLPWMILVMGIARVARKIDSIIARIGLNPAITGDGLGRGGIPGMLALTVARSLGGTVAKTIGRNGGSHGAAAGSAGKKPPNPPGGGAGRQTTTGGFGRNGRGGAAGAAAGFAAGSAGAAGSHTTASSATQSTSAQASATETQGTQTSATANATKSSQSSTHTSAGKAAGQTPGGAPGQGPSSPQSGTRRSAVSRTADGPQQSRFHIHTPTTGAGVGAASGPAGTARQTASHTRNVQGAASGTSTTAPPSSPTSRPVGQTPGTAGKPDAATAKPGDTRFTAVPPSARQEGHGTAATAPGSSTTRQSSVSTQRTQAESSHTATREATGTAQQRAQSDRPPSPSGTAGKGPSAPVSTRQTQVGQTPSGTGRNATPAADMRPASGGQSASHVPPPARSSPAADTRPARQERGPSPATASPPKAQRPAAQQESRPPTTAATPPQAQRPVSATTARQESRPTTATATPQQTQRPLSGTAGSAPAPARPDRSVKSTRPPAPAAPQPQKPSASNTQHKPPTPGGKIGTTPPKPPSRRKKGETGRGK
ncbi:MAG: hypothetical protein RR949_01075 [Oscillospiraceae bacterium]